MPDLNAKNFPLNGILIILLALGALMLVGVLTALAWHQENAWPSAPHARSGQNLTAPIPRPARIAPAILFGQPPIPQANRQAREL